MTEKNTSLNEENHNSTLRNKTEESQEARNGEGFLQEGRHLGSRTGTCHSWPRRREAQAFPGYPRRSFKVGIEYRITEVISVEMLSTAGP